MSQNNASERSDASESLEWSVFPFMENLRRSIIVVVIVIAVAVLVIVLLLRQIRERLPRSG